MIAHVRPDIILLTNFDYDASLVAARAFSARIAASGWALPHAFAFAPNTGVRTGLDIDGDGYNSGPRDMQGYGAFPGQGGMVILSRVAPLVQDSQDFSDFLWADLPDNAQRLEGGLADVQRLSSVGHWRVSYDIGPERLDVLAWHAGTPAFDDASKRNARRNGDENRFWMAFLDGELDITAPQNPFVLMGTSNLDPYDGQGQRRVMTELLGHPALQDPRPQSPGAARAAQKDGGANAGHRGDPSFDTADFRDEKGPGNLRVDYVLPSKLLTVLQSGVFWPDPDSPHQSMVWARDPQRSWHAIVWADLGF